MTIDYEHGYPEDAERDYDYSDDWTPGERLRAEAEFAERIDVMNTCGDCCTGRCHWGGETSRANVAAVEADPTHDKPCGCDRHAISYLYRLQETA